MKVACHMLVIAGLLRCACAHTVEPDAPANPLSGPTVREPGVPGNSTTFTGRGRREGERVIDHRTFLKALESLRDGSVAAEVRLTREQEEQLARIERDYRLAIRAYFEKNLNDIRDMRDVLEIRGDQPPTESSIRKGIDELRRNIVGAQPGADDTMSDAAIKDAAREKARRIYQGAPSANDVHQRIWKLLLPAQRDLLTSTLDALVAQQEAQRRAFLSPGAMMTDATSADPMNSMSDMATKPAMGAMPGAMNGTMGMGNSADSKTNDPASLLGMDPAKIAADDPRLPERVRRRIRSMKPDARAEAIGRYLADLKLELAEAQAAAKIDKAAAPTVDRVNIPTPEKK
jgi:hypothetical protein